MNEMSFRDSNSDVPSPFLPTTGGTLQSLNLSNCRKVSDAKFSSLPIKSLSQRHI